MLGARQAGKTGENLPASATTPEAAERVLAIAACYFKTQAYWLKTSAPTSPLTQSDPTVGAMTCAYALVLGQLLQGEALDSQLSGKLMKQVQTGALPFHHIVSPNMQMPKGQETPPQTGEYASPDALLTVSSIAQGVQEQQVQVEPAWKVSPAVRPTLRGVPPASCCLSPRRTLQRTILKMRSYMP